MQTTAPDCAKNRKRVFLIRPGALHILLLRECGLELGLSLRHDDLVHETALELGGKQADLLSVCLDRLRQDLGLGVQRAERVIVLGHVRLHSKAHHC